MSKALDDEATYVARGWPAPWWRQWHAVLAGFAFGSSVVPVHVWLFG